MFTILLTVNKFKYYQTQVWNNNKTIKQIYESQIIFVKQKFRCISFKNKLQFYETLHINYYHRH